MVMIINFVSLAFEFAKNLTCFTGIFKLNGFNAAVNFPLFPWKSSSAEAEAPPKIRLASRHLEVMMVDIPLIRPYVLGECFLHLLVVPLDSHDLLQGYR